MKKIFLLCLSIAIIFSATVFAAREIIEASGDYYMDPRLDETAATATARAREEAKRSAVEKAGVYVQSYSKMIDLALDYDEVRTVAAQLLKIQDEDSKVEVTPDNMLKFTVTIKALVDDNEVGILKAMMQDKQSLEESTRQYRQLQKEYDDLKQQMEELQRIYDSSPASEKNDVKKDVEQNSRKFNALQEWEAGNNFYWRGEYQNAIDAYNRALKLNPNLPEVYNNRGNSYAALGMYDAAMNDFRVAVKFLPDNPKILNNLGSANFHMKNYYAAIEEYTLAINLNPELAEAYYNRALAYSYLGRYLDAFPDAQKAVNLNPSDADSQSLYNQLKARLGR